MFDVKLTTDDEHDVVVLEIHGEFTLDEKPKVDPIVAEAVECGCRGVVLDLSKIRFIDSAGLMVVLSVYNKFMKAGMAMTVATNGNRYAEQKIQEVGLLRVPKFEAFESVEEAKRALSRRDT